MGGQMATAERMKVPYILIMGKMEAMNGTVMIRDVSTRAQETIKISDLAGHIKKLVK
jgi:histidyl-tRNA synthetase